jgi:hypothetical protein
VEPLIAYKNYFVVNSDIAPSVMSDGVFWDVMLCDLIDGDSR